MTVPSPAPAPVHALAPATTDAGGDDVAGVAGAAAASPDVNRGKGAVTAISPALPAPPPVAPNLESMLQVARESLAAAAASGDDDDELDSDDDNVILLFHQQFLFV